MGFEFGRHPIADKTSRTKHVGAAGLLARDGGSTPPASTILYGRFLLIVNLTGLIEEELLSFDILKRRHQN